jgi:hypothetical protein
VISTINSVDLPAYDLATERFITNPLGLVGGVAEAATPISQIICVITLKPHNLTIAFKRKNMCGNTIEKPAIVRDHNRTSGEL